MPSNSLWNTDKFLRITVSIILILTIIFLLIQIKPVLSVILDFVTTILYPLIIAIILYYVFRPLRNFMVKHKIPRILSVIIIFLLIYLAISIIIMFIWPLVAPQIAEFTSTPKEKLAELESKTLDILNLFNFTKITQEQFRQTMILYLQKLAVLISENIGTTIGSIAKVASYFIIAPFILFYLLNEDYKMKGDLVSSTPKGSRRDFKTIMADIDSTLSDFINSQVLIAAIVGFLIYLGYALIGLNYAFLLALIAFVFNLIPFMGPFISTIPALFIGLSESPWMAFEVILVVSCVHLLDLNLISPRIVGQKLNIHPITVIFLLVASFSIFGILGMFLITPLYTAVKVVIDDLYGDQLEKWF